jgi:PAS domain S-box-containing protein
MKKTESQSAHEFEVVETGKATVHEDSRPQSNGVHDLRTVMFPAHDAAGEIAKLGAMAVDMTEPKRIEEALRTSEQRFRVTLGGSPIVVCMTDRDLRYTWIYNPVAGFTPDSLVGKRDDEVDLEPEDAAALIEFKQRVLESGVGAREEFNLRLPEGDAAFDIVAEPLREPGGAIVGLTIAATDITERKRVEKALRESEERLQSVTSSLPGALFRRILHPDGTLEYPYMSSGIHDFLGITPEEFMAHPEMASSYFHPDDLPFWQQALEASAADLSPVDMELRYRLPTGGYGWVRQVATVRRAETGDIIWDGIGLDITEEKRAREGLRESQARLSKAAEMAKIGYWVWDEIKDKAIYCSDELAKMYGVDSGADLAALTPSHAADLDRVHPEDRERVEQVMHTAMDTKRGFDVEHKIINSKGETRYLRVIEEPVLDERGRLIRSNGITQDITAHKRAEEEIRKLNEELELRVEERTAELHAAQANHLRQGRLATLGQLTATVSHELRNPLGSIRNSTFILRENLQDEDPRKRRALERIERNVVRCDRIVDELLDFTRISDIEAQPTALDDWLAAVLEAQTLPSGVSLQREFGSADAVVPLDRDRFRRAVINVVDNACQAMLGEGDVRGKSGERVLTLRTQQRNGRIEVVVEDTGPGIAPDVYENLFEPLFSTKGFGVGLGLPVVKQIMERHGGGVEVETEQGRGTKVCLWLPVTESTV